MTGPRLDKRGGTPWCADGDPHCHCTECGCGQPTGMPPAWLWGLLVVVAALAGFARWG